MPDREKVIDALEECTTSEDCINCSYHEFHGRGCFQKLMKDALALMQESERKTGSWDYGTQCSVCKGTIIPPKDRKVRVNFCPWCGADMRGGYDE